MSSTHSVRCISPLTATRSVWTFKFGDFDKWAGLEKSAMEVVREKLGQLTQDDIGKMAEDGVHFASFEQHANSIAYIPSGWFVAEWAGPEKVVGFRTTAIAAKGLDVVQHLVNHQKACSEDIPNMQLMEALLAAVSGTGAATGAGQ